MKPPSTSSANSPLSSFVGNLPVLAPSFEKWGERMEKRRTTKRKYLTLCLIVFVSLFPLEAWPGSIDEVTFLSKVEVYETIVDTSLITPEGKRLPIAKGMRLNVAGFTMTEAFVISRMDKPNGFVRKTDISPSRGGSGIRDEIIKEEILK